MIRRATADDAEALHSLAAETFPLATTPGTDPDDIAAFIDANLSRAAFDGYLADGDRILLVEETDGVLVGYTMLVLGAPYDADVRTAVAERFGDVPVAELSKCYVRASSHGTGLARRLVDASIAAVAERGVEALWLGVNQHNPRAVAFYAKCGFERIGMKAFRVGERLEHDFVLAQAVADSAGRLDEGVRMRTTGTVAIVTGGASGLGLAVAERLAADGATVVIVDLPGSPGAEVAARLGGAFAPTDVRDTAQVQAAVDAAVALGDLRIVVNCAGIVTGHRTVGRDGPFPADAFRRTIEVNLIGTFEVIRLAAAAMAANEPVDGDRGVIVSTSSVAAFDGQIGQAAYSASKAAVAGMTLPIARDLAGLGIRVVAIAPGIMDTPMLASLPEEARASLGAQVPHPARLGTPGEFASLVAHIVENGYLNGEVIRLDGAIRLAPK